MLVALAAASSFFSFQMPSHNIGCVGDATCIRCDTRFATKYARPQYKPRGCDLDWGPLAMKPSGRPHVQCVGDTALGSDSPVLHYGKSKLYGANGTPLRVTLVTDHNPSPFTVLGWYVTDVKAAMTDLASRGIVFKSYTGFDQDPDGIWTAPNGRRVAWFEDPDGNIISLSQPPSAPA